MKEQRQLIPAAGLLATITAAIYMVVQLHGQTMTPTLDLTDAATADVVDGQGRVVLSGPFQAVNEVDDDIERKAALAPTGVDADAAGEAEVEFARNAPTEQEAEFSVRNLAPDVALTFMIDGNAIATATTDARGRAEVEIIVRLPAATASR